MDFQVPIIFEDVFKGIKTPIIPPLIRSICEELIARVASRQLSILPSPLSTLFFNADAMAGDLRRSAEIDDVIKLLHFGRKDLTDKQRMAQRARDLEPYQTSVITRALFHYIELCSDGIDLTVDFPAFGYIILGPPKMKGDGKPNIKSYNQAIEAFITHSMGRQPIKRDIFCFMMHFLTQIYQLTGDSYRSEPALCGMTRYLLANRFGQELIRLNCTSCHQSIDDDNNGCKVCSYVASSFKPPFRARVIDTMLQYIPLQYWRGTLNISRGSTSHKGVFTTTLEDLKSSFGLKRASNAGESHVESVTKGRRNSKKSVAAAGVAGTKAAKPSVKPNHTRIQAAGSTENNGEALQNSREGSVGGKSEDSPVEKRPSYTDVKADGHIGGPRGSVGVGDAPALPRAESLSSLSIEDKDIPKSNLFINRSTARSSPDESEVPDDSDPPESKPLRRVSVEEDAILQKVGKKKADKEGKKKADKERAQKKKFVTKKKQHRSRSKRRGRKKRRSASRKPKSKSRQRSPKKKIKEKGRRRDGKSRGRSKKRSKSRKRN